MYVLGTQNYFFYRVCVLIYLLFWQGCDGSILLEDTSSFTGEQTAGPNNNSVRGFNVVAKIKSEVEKVCPGIVSCADILAIAARDSTVIVSTHIFFPFPLLIFCSMFRWD